MSLRPLMKLARVARFFRIPEMSGVCSPRLVALLALLGAGLIVSFGENPPLELRPNDVIAWIGSADAVAAQETGHFESLLRAAHPTIRVRSFAWEADTVYAQPRDFKFPALTNQLDAARATVVLCQFGQGESFGGAARLNDFETAYRKLIQAIGRGRRVALITPHSFERAEAPLPNLLERNAELSAYLEVIRKLATEEKATLLDMNAELRAIQRERQITTDGWHLSRRGHALAAQALARAMGLDTAGQAGQPDAEGRWANPKFESLRQMIVEKNRLWFDYSRPMNWAFLGGDRVEQPSSRDHINPAIRWFPAEMEKFLPLIEQTESRIEQMSRGAQ